MTKKAAQAWLKSEIVIDYDREPTTDRQFQRDVRKILQQVEKVPLGGYAPGYRLYSGSNDGESSIYILTKGQEVVSAMRYYDYGHDLMAESICGLCVGSALYEKDDECGDIMCHAERHVFDLMFLLGRFEDCDTFAEASVLWTNRLNRTGLKQLT